MRARAGAQRRRIVRVREAQRQIALGRLAMAGRLVADIDERRKLVARLVDDTLPQASSYGGIDFIGRMRFAGRMAVAQASLGQARTDAAAASDERISDLRRVDTNVEIATRMLAADTARRRSEEQRRTLETVSGSTKSARQGSDR